MLLSKFLSIAIAFIIIFQSCCTTQAQSASLPVLSQATASSIAQASCYSTNFCVAVGSYRQGSQDRALILTKQAGRWVVDSIEEPSVTHDDAQLSSVSCPTANFCMAVGQYRVSNQGWWPWLLVYRDGAWHQLSIGVIGQTAITALSCSSASFCMAVGGVDSGGMATSSRVYIFNGLSWMADTSAALNQLGTVQAVNCLPADKQCVIAGGSRFINTSHYLVANYNDGQWAIDASLAPSEFGSLQSIECSSSVDCVAIGNSYSPGGRLVARRSASGWLTLGRSSPSISQGEHFWRSAACTISVCFAAGESSQIGNDSSSIHATIDQFGGAPADSSLALELSGSHGSTIDHTATSRLNIISCLAAQPECLAFGVYFVGTKQSLLLVTYKSDSWQSSDPLLPPDAAISVDISSIEKNPFSSLNQIGLQSISSSARVRQYVAFGDSLTTGSSIPTCQPDRGSSPWGCTTSPTAATPYPVRVATALGLQLDRTGIWGYRVQEAAQARRQGHNSEGSWQPQLESVEQANRLVTGALGINDLNFSDVAGWLKLYLKPGADYVTIAAQQIIQQRSTDFDQLFASLSAAKKHGANVVVVLYYNPYDSGRLICSQLKDVGGRLVDAIDSELTKRALQAGLSVADPRIAFRGHGSASRQPYVFGNQCAASSALADWLPKWLSGGDAKATIAVGFDPHPNNAGTTVLATTILKEVN